MKKPVSEGVSKTGDIIAAVIFGSLIMFMVGWFVIIAVVTYSSPAHADFPRHIPRHEKPTRRPLIITALDGTAILATEVRFVSRVVHPDNTYSYLAVLKTNEMLAISENSYDILRGYFARSWEE